MRKTKNASLATRKLILDVACQIFLDEGVGNASLEKIAGAANLTRGAVYWHFENKISLLIEVQSEYLAPLIKAASNSFKTTHYDKDPLDSIRIALEEIFGAIIKHHRVLDALKIIAHGTDAIDQLATYVIENNQVINQVTSEIKKLYFLAQEKRLLAKGITPTIATLETRTFIIGLIYQIISSIDSNNRKNSIKKLIRSHIHQKRLSN